MTKAVCRFLVCVLMCTCMYVCVCVCPNNVDACRLRFTSAPVLPTPVLSPSRVQCGGFILRASVSLLCLFFSRQEKKNRERGNANSHARTGQKTNKQTKGAIDGNRKTADKYSIRIPRVEGGIHGQRRRSLFLSRYQSIYIHADVASFLSKKKE
jgi:hypothetical protein